jgi:DNA-binding PadR family transcriptional regulator
VIAHLSSLGRLGNDDVGPLGFTQKGMSAALAIRQGTLTKVLSRLEAARVIEVDKRHVRGEPRRLKVYRLTALGESVARELRHPRSPPKAGIERRAISDPAVEVPERI